MIYKIQTAACDGLGVNTASMLVPRPRLWSVSCSRPSKEFDRTALVSSWVGRSGPRGTQTPDSASEGPRRGGGTCGRCGLIAALLTVGGASSPRAAMARSGSRAEDPADGCLLTAAPPVAAFAPPPRG